MTTARRISLVNPMICSRCWIAIKLKREAQGVSRQENDRPYPNSTTLATSTKLVSKSQFVAFGTNSNHRRYFLFAVPATCFRYGGLDVRLYRNLHWAEKPGDLCFAFRGWNRAFER